MGAPLAGKLRRTGHLGILTAGLGIAVAAIAGLAFVTQAAPFAALVPPLVAFGAGTSLTMTAANSGAVENTDDASSGAAIVNTSLEVGGALGVAVVISLLNGRYLAATPPHTQTPNLAPARLTIRNQADHNARNPPPQPLRPTTAPYDQCGRTATGEQRDRITLR